MLRREDVSSAVLRWSSRVKEGYLKSKELNARICFVLVLALHCIIFIVLYCIVLCCIVLCCIVLCCIVLYCVVFYCIVLYCIVLYCIVLYCIIFTYDSYFSYFLFSSSFLLIINFQKCGLRFLWKNLIFSFKEVNKTGSGGGCILAHCMGLGKTLTTICFTLTLLSSPSLTSIIDPVALYEEKERKERIEKEKIARKKARKAEKADLKLLREGMENGNMDEDENDNNNGKDDDDDDNDDDMSIGLPSVIENVPLKRLFHKILILAPVNTLQNWFNEYINWTPIELVGHTNVKLLSSSTKNNDRMKMLRSWNNDGGVLILGYELFRIMTEGTKKNSDYGVGIGSSGESDLGTDGKAKPIKGQPLTADQGKKSEQAEARRSV